MRAAVALPLLLAAALPACAQAPEPVPPKARPAPALSPAPAPSPPSAPPKSHWTITAAAAPENISPGLTHLHHSLEKRTAEGPHRANLHLVRFNSSSHTFKVVDQGDTKPGRYRNLAEAMQSTGCLAGCNGGFFHPDFRPAGLVVADGERFNRFENAKLLSGVILVDSRGPRLLRRSEFEDRPGITQLLQAGPYLVDRGKTVSGLSSSPDRTRTFVATDGKGGWTIGLCTNISLAELGTVLADPALTGDLRISRALNLDGGSSSSLYAQRAAGASPYHHRGFATVRNFIGIVPR